MRGTLPAERKRDSEPQLSVILATDGLELAAEVLAHLSAQTARDRIELVLATPPGSVGPDAIDGLVGFHSVRVIEAETRDSPPAARAAGVAAAGAPLVAFGETHCFPAPDWAEVLIEAHRGAWAAVGPEIENENPERAASWANLYVDYAAWVAPARPGPAPDLPGHNSSYKRSLLLEYGDDLARLFEAESILHWDLRFQGAGLYVEPRAKVRHRNITQFRAATVEHFNNGRCFGALRSRNWHPARRALYAAASPLIPLLRLRRIVREVRRSARRDILPRALPMILSALMAHAADELTGYAIGAGESVRTMATYELDRDSYAQA